MLKKQFKAESKKLLDMMINSIYTNPEIFLRELISNASDALDKVYYRSLTDKKIKINKDKLEIWIESDKEDRTITIKDNGCGMTKEELEDNLGTIAKSGSELFKENHDTSKNISIIGQFGVGFYSAFMVADKVEVDSLSIDSNQSHKWASEGVDGYTIEKSEKKEVGTTIKLYLKENSDILNTNELLDEYRLSGIIKKYSDYIKYPIKMNLPKENDKSEVTTINSMIPIWKKNKKEVKNSEYEDFYIDKYYDYEKPLKVIHTSVEGLTSYNALMFIPSHAPFNYYTKEYEKGLSLYSKGVLIMDKCKELLPDYFSFVKGLVDSEDIALNISRETMQQNNQVRLIAKNIENKIKNELTEMLKEERDKYETFFKEFGMSLKHGIYSSYGSNKELLQDLLMFYSSKDEKYITLKEYTERLRENQEEIYYASGETIDKIKMLPQVEFLVDKGYEVIYLTEYIDEFVIKTLNEYNGKKFTSATDKELNLDSEENKEEIEKINQENKDLLTSLKDLLSDDIDEVRFTNKLKEHPVCLTSSGDISLEMEKIINNMTPGQEKVKAKTILEINSNHPISDKLRTLQEANNQEELSKYTKILYNQARLISGLNIDNPTELAKVICDMISK